MSPLPWDRWVLDCSVQEPPGFFCFCPVTGDLDGDYSIVYGMNYVADKPPGKLVAIVHEDGQAAVESWCAEHAKELEVFE